MTTEVRIIAGPARCGKIQQLLAQYLGKLQATPGDEAVGTIPQCCWIAPNHTAASQLQDSLVQGSDRSILAPGVHAFASFAQMVIASSEKRVRAISPLQKRRVLRHLIRAAIGQRKLQHFASVANTPGFVSQVDEAIAELKRADKWPEEFQQWSEQRPRSDRRNRELAYLYTAYQTHLHRHNLYDSEGRFWIAREILAATPSKERQYAVAVVSGFNDFTSAQLDILRLVGERSQSLQISLTLEQPKTQVAGIVQQGLGFAKTSQTLGQLREIFPQLEITFLPVAEASEGSLLQFQQQAFREPVATTADGEEFAEVEIVAAASESGEIEAIAERVKSLCVEQKVRPEQIVIVHRGGEEAVARIASALPDYGIPFACETSARLESEPLVRALHALLRLVTDDWPFQTLLEVVGNRLFTRLDDTEPPADFRECRRVAIEYCLRSAQLPAGKDALLQQLAYRVEHTGASGHAGYERHAAQLEIALKELRQLESWLSELPADAAIEEWIVAIQRLLLQLGVFGSVGVRSREASAWRQLCRGLRSIAKAEQWLEVSQPLSLSEMQELVTTVTYAERVAAAHDAVGRVRILSAESARKLSVPHVFLAGLNEQAFSAVSTSADARPSADTQADEFSAEESQEADASVARNDAMLLFYELITRPTASLTLSYPSLDSKGQPLPPSPLLTDLQRSIAPKRIAVHQLTMGQTASTDKVATSISGFRRQAVEQALDGESRWLAGMVSQPEFVRSGSSILAGVACVAERGKREIYGEFEGLVSSPQARDALAKHFGSEFMWSPSRLENYAACPFRFFASQLLRAEPLNELTLRNDARRRGSLLHQVLATIHEELRHDVQLESAGGASADELVTRFLAALEALVKATPLRGIDQSLREIERREIEAWVPSYAEQEINYRSQWQHLDGPPRPAHFEVRFGPEAGGGDDQADRASTGLPFELDLGEESIRLTGQIDRVDVGQVGTVTVFNIIDYKSGKEVRLKHEKVRSGHQLQLPLYALAAEQLLLADQQALGLATGYWNIQGKGFQTKNGGSLQLRELAESGLKASADWNSLETDILGRVQEIVRGIRSGDFPVYNEDEHCTRSCEFSTICRVSQIRSLEKVWPAEESNE